jgi:transcription antitermination protein NusB
MKQQNMNSMSKKPLAQEHNFKKKSTARRTAMQALYSLEVSKSHLSTIEEHYLEDRNPKNIDTQYFKLLFNNIPLHQDQLDQLINKHSDRNTQHLDPIELCILRVACYELLFCKDIPFKVIITESLNLSTMFGSNTSYKFINSVVDQLAKDCRSTFTDHQ